MSTNKKSQAKSETAREIENSFPLFEYAVTINPHEIAQNTGAVNGLGRAVCLIVNKQLDTSHLELADKFSAYGILESAYDDTIQAVWPEVAQGIEPADTAVYALMSTLSQRNKKMLKDELNKKDVNRAFNYNELNGLYVVNTDLQKKSQGNRCPMNKSDLFKEVSYHASKVASAAYSRELNVQRFYKTRQTLKYLLMSTDSERQAQRIG